MIPDPSLVPQFTHCHTDPQMINSVVHGSGSSRHFIRNCWIFVRSISHSRFRSWWHHLLSWY